MTQDWSLRDRSDGLSIVCVALEVFLTNYVEVQNTLDSYSCILISLLVHRAINDDPFFGRPSNYWTFESETRHCEFEACARLEL
jgi:hypothetical protein